MQDGASRDPNESAVLSFLEQGLRELGHPPDQLAILVPPLTHLISTLSSWAGQINLTGHRDPLEIAGRLVLDAAALSATLPELATADSLVDLGSGAGFPGLPLAILHPRLAVRLVDSRMKRHHFQRAARRELDLGNVTSLLGRAEELEPEPAQLVVAQAMTQPRRALELMARWLEPGGLAVLPASDAASPPDCVAPYSAVELREYRVPLTGTRRKVWVAHTNSV